jgi:UDP-N-acetylmuramoylalanine--D-glutamate ligase
VLNIAEDHLDWHGDMNQYGLTKGKIYNNTRVCCVYNVGDKTTSDLMQSALNSDSAQAVGFTVNTPAPNEIGWVEDILVDRAFVDDPAIALELASLSDLNSSIVLSPHLMANIAAAASLARAAGVQPHEIAAALKEFELDAHRIQLVLEKDGISWVDDSKATNPHAAAAALASFDSVVWIVGGLLKGVDISDLVSRYSGKVRAAIVIGLDRQPVLEAFAKLAPATEVFEIVSEPAVLMDEVVRIAKDVAQSGDTVLLAPAAASMDQFKDYAHRGESFSTAVKREV